MVVASSGSLNQTLILSHRFIMYGPSIYEDRENRSEQATTQKRDNNGVIISIPILLTPLMQIQRKYVDRVSKMQKPTGNVKASR